MAKAKKSVKHEDAAEDRKIAKAEAKKAVAKAEKGKKGCK